MQPRSITIAEEASNCYRNRLHPSGNLSFGFLKTTSHSGESY